MKNLFYILLFIISTSAYGQTEIPKDSFPPLKKGNLDLNESLDNYLNFNNKNETGYKFQNKIVSDYEALREKGVNKVMDLKFPPIDVYLGPPLESNEFTRFPFANDYSYYSGYTFSDNMWITSSSIQNTYPSLGAVRSIGMNFNYQPLDWLRISAGPYGSKYNFINLYNNDNNRMGHYNDVGVSGALKFILHDRIRLNAYGQYSVYGGRNGVQGPMMNMYPQTYYGGTIELKITEKFGIEGGVIRELNPFNGKWVNRPYFAPVFYTK
ncbi:hypothetical protein JGH11_15175 [Dysgonomonas sp. Marseille-P4677]|uniref:hypothetical protein n=1 Tax=Dysgonomonas sp. Marseille-P4677 TaxID=2364790 RepID=UPI001913CC6E|nr:hypothetical protein [Dysgonomonas sp. Marseille-P4677]MBK5722216.1 hypothetical protein [Dysgonomonas sp. Marseille-P4677]